MNCKNILLFLSFLILLSSIGIYWSFDKNFEEIEITSEENSKAKCLDGSNYKFLFSPSSNKKNSFYIYFEGGGFCGTENYSPLNTNASLEYCLERSKTRLGNNGFSFISKKVFKPFARFLSSSKFFNPNFYDYNKIYIKYCDGTMHMGNLENPVEYQGEKLYIRGEENVKAVFDFLIKEKNFLDAENVLVTGSSAGGLAAVFYSKYIHELLDNKKNKNINYKVISDSGYFYRPNFSLKFGKERNVMRHMLEILRDNLNLKKTETMKINQCQFNDFIDCIFPSDYLLNGFSKNYEILFLTSSYDSWALSRLLGTECIFGYNVYQNCNETEKKYFEKYSEEMIEEVKELINKDESKKITTWINKGFFHTYLMYSWSWGNKKYGVEEYSIEKFVSEWYNGVLDSKNGNKKIYYDGVIKEKLVDFFWLLCFLNTDF